MSSIESAALVVRTVVWGESDAILTLVTETHGKVGALARGVRKPTSRLAGVIEPFHTLHVRIDERRGELGALREAKLVRVRAGLVAKLDAMEAGGTLLRWARHLFPARTPEPHGFAAIIAVLDELDAGVSPRSALVRGVFPLLASVGYGLELGSCVGCAKPCPEGRPAYVDAARGGLVCRACGGGPRVLSPSLRQVARALQRGDDVQPTDAQAEELLALGNDALVAHADYTR